MQLRHRATKIHKDFIFNNLHYCVSGYPACRQVCAFVVKILFFGVGSLFEFLVK